MKTHEQLLAEVNDPNRAELQPGTVEYRFAWLLKELDERFPGAHNPVMSHPSPEQAYIDAIDLFKLRHGEWCAWVD